MFAVGLDAALDIGDPRVPVAMILKPRADSFIHKRSLDIVRIRSFLNLFLYLRVQTGRPFHKGTALYMTVINLPRNRRILPDMAHPGDCPRTVYVFPSISWPKLRRKEPAVHTHSCPFASIRVHSGLNLLQLIKTTSSIQTDPSPEPLSPNRMYFTP